MKSSACDWDWRSQEDCRNRWKDSEISRRVPTFDPMKNQWVAGEVPTLGAWWIIPAAILGALAWVMIGVGVMG